MAKGRWRPRRWWTALSGLGVLLWLGVFAGVSQADSPTNPSAGSNHMRPSQDRVRPGAIANSPCPAWGIVPSANPAGEESFLTSVSAVSANDAWAVGYYMSRGVARTLTEHWDGKAWTVVPSPNPTNDDNFLEGVAAISANNVWAVGGSGLARAAGSQRTLIEHWDGVQWSIVPSPNFGAGNNYLYGVSAALANDAWAVGYYGDPHRGEHALTLHWDGSGWTQVPVPTPSDRLSNSLRAVTVVSTSDVWAVGIKFNIGPVVLILHWDGAQWQAYPDRFVGIMNGVAAVAANDVWAAGLHATDVEPETTQVLHWNGGSWATVPNYNGPNSPSQLLGVAAVSASDIWAVGSRGRTVRHAVIVHWDGSQMTTVDAPDAGSGQDELHGVVTLPGGDLLAVGNSGPAGSRRTLIERYTDQCAPPTPAPTATNTPVLATPTPSAVPTLPATSLPGSGSRTFPETGKTVSGLFLDYWDNHGGLPQQGFPISQLFGEVSDLNGKPYTVQYFERAVFEYHPENQAPFNVLLSQLGTFQYKKKYPGGAPGQQPNTTPGSVLFPETGKRLGHRFLQYWQQNGGLPQQGYPISDEFTEVSDLNGKTYLVQYFERAVFELHPENQPPYDVLLSQLGTFQYKKKYGAR